MNTCVYCGDYCNEDEIICINYQSKNEIEVILKTIKEEYDSLDKQFEKAYKSIFIIEDTIQNIDHEMIALSLEIENIGITINQLCERLGVKKWTLSK